MPGISIMLRKVTYFNGWEVQCRKREVAWNPRLCQMAPGSDPFWNQTASLVCVFTFSQKNMENHFEQIPSISHSAVRNKILTTQTLHLSQRERDTVHPVRKQEESTIWTILNFLCPFWSMNKPCTVSLGKELTIKSQYVSNHNVTVSCYHRKY